jgi:hypothetical protein
MKPGSPEELSALASLMAAKSGAEEAAIWERIAQSFAATQTPLFSGDQMNELTAALKEIDKRLADIEQVYHLLALADDGGAG